MAGDVTNTYPGPIKFARVNATADGVNVIVAAVTGKSLRILGYMLTNKTTAGTSTWQDTQGTPAIYGDINLALGGVASYEGGVTAPAFDVASGFGLNISNGTAVDVLGHVTYMEV